MIKETAMEKFDNDYDALFSSIEDNNYTDSIISIKTHLLNCANIYGATLNPSITYNMLEIDTLLSLYQNFQISVPVMCDDWDAENDIPCITFIPDDYDESLYTEVMAFNSSGDTLWLSLDTIPDFPVLVLGSCERVDENGFLKSPIFIGNEDEINLDDNKYIKSSEAIPNNPTQLIVSSGAANQLMLEWTDNSSDEIGFKIERSYNGSGFVQIATTGSNINGYVDNNLTPAVQYFYKVRAYNSSGNSNYTNSAQYIASPRTTGNREIIEKMKFTDLSYYEKWISGAPEIRVRVAWGTTTTTQWIIDGDFIEPGKRSDINNKWFYWNHAVSRWYPVENSKVWTFHFTEEDPSSGEKTVKFNVSYEDKTSSTTTIKTGAEVSFTIGKKDDVITYKPVIWWNPFSDIYDNGKFQWVMKNEY